MVGDILPQRSTERNCLSSYLIWIFCWGGPSWSQGKTSQSTKNAYLFRHDYLQRPSGRREKPKTVQNIACVSVCRSCFFFLSVFTKKIPQNKNNAQLVFESWRAENRFPPSYPLLSCDLCHCLVFHISIRFFVRVLFWTEFLLFLFFFHICIWCLGRGLEISKADDFLEDILNLEAGLEEADRNRVMDTTSEHHHQHQTLAPEVKILSNENKLNNRYHVNSCESYQILYFCICPFFLFFSFSFRWTNV